MISEDEKIEQEFNTITLQMGPYTMLAAKVKLKSGIDIDSAVDDINDLEVRLKERFPNLKWCFMEPDVTD